MVVQPLPDGATRGRNSISKPLSASGSSLDIPEPSANEPTLSESSSLRSIETAVIPAEVDQDNPNDVSKSHQSPTHASAHASDASNSSESNFWLHMTATLDACFNLQTQDASSDQLHDAMSDDMIAEAPRVMRMFLSHGDACTKIEASALDLVSNGPTAEHEEDEPLKAYSNMLDNLEQLREKASMLESTISRLAGEAAGQCEKEQTQTTIEFDDGDKPASPKHAAHSELKRVFAACMPVLRARVANLTMAQDLIDSAQENISISLRMENLGID